MKRTNRAIIDLSGVIGARQTQNDIEVSAVADDPDEENVCAELLVVVLRRCLSGLVGRESLRASTRRRRSITPGDIVKVAECVDGEHIDVHWDEKQVSEHAHDIASEVA